MARYALRASPRKKATCEWWSRPMVDGAIDCCQTCAELVYLLVAAHYNVECFSAQHYTVSKSVKFC